MILGIVPSVFCVLGQGIEALSTLTLRFIVEGFEDDSPTHFRAGS